MGLTDAEQTALIWPIKAKGAVNRLQPLNDPAISEFYQNAMEQGRFLESSIADANLWLLQKKTLLNEYIISYTHMNQLAVDGQLGHHARVPKYIADGISILQTAQRLQQEIVSLNEAVNGNIIKILAIKDSMLQMVDTANNSLANLLNNICNWGIPSLPSIPNLFPDQLWNWNGYEFSPLALFAALKSNTNFNFNFKFSDCSFGPTTTAALFNTNPLTTTSYSGLVYGSANYDAPQNGQIIAASQDLTDSAFVSQMQGTTATPYYSPSFNPNENMLGAMPDPHFILSDWQMPAATYVSDIVSICPQLRSNTVFLTDTDYSNPNLAVRQPALQKSLQHNINLAQIVASNYDPFIVSAWLIYLNLARNGRGGVWIPNFETVYQQYLQPSITNLLTLSIPWNNVLPSMANYFWEGTWNTGNSYVVGDIVVFNNVNYVATQGNTGMEPDTNPTVWSTPIPPGTVFSNTPTIALITTLQSLPTIQLNHLLWQLSYIEASLLGYTRNSNFDAYQDSNYLTGPTGASLDYVPTTVTATQNGEILGEGTAEFPVPITFPAAMKNSLDIVIGLASANIQNDLNYLSPRLGNRFTYNQFAVATQVDRFSQFWRDFATNLTNFLAQDPYLVQFAITYPEILDGAIDPLSSALNTAAYNSLLSDVNTRNRSWIPGTPLPNIPVQPVTGLTSTFVPGINSNGWTMPPTDLDPVAFLARPDIVVLPIPVQIAMLRTNLSYAGVNTWASNMQTSITNQIDTANSILASLQQVGFIVQINCDAITQTSITSNVLTVVVNNSYQTGDNVMIEGTNEAFLNGQVVTVLTASATQFTANFTNPNYSLTPDTGTTALVTYVGGTATITNIALVSNLLTVTASNVAGVPFGIGQSVTFSGVTTSTYLNGQTVVVLSSNSSQFTAAFTHPNDPSHVDTGGVAASTSAPVSFDTILFDFTGNVTNRNTFTIQTAGNYVGSGQIVFVPTTPASGDGVYTVTVTQNGTPIYTSSSSPTQAAPQTLGISFIAAAAHGDVFQVLASHNFPGTQIVDGCTSSFSMIESSIAVPQTESTADESVDATNTFTVSLPTWFTGTTLPPLSAVHVLSNGTVSPVDTLVPAITSVSVTSNVVTVTTTGHHFKAGDFVIFSGLQNATFLNGMTVTVSATGLTGTVFTAPFTHANFTEPGSPPESGSALYAVDATSNAILAPFVDGVTVAAAAAGQSVQVANSYGGIFSATGESFPTGSILYVGLQGLLTNNFSSLYTVGGWIVVVGKAVSTGSFLFEPNIPNRTTIL